MKSKSVEFLQIIKAKLADTQSQVAAVICVEGPSEALCGAYLSLANASNRVNSLLAQVSK